MTVLKVLTVSDGPPASALTNSGVALGLTTALAASNRVDLVAAVSARPEGLQRLLLMAATIRPTKKWWWASFNLGPLNIRVRSALRERAIRRARREGGVDVVLHIRNIYLPSSTPYVAFIDSTSKMANQGWSAWRPTTERARRARFDIEREYFQGALRVVTAGTQAAASVVNDYEVPSERVQAVGGGVNFNPLPEMIQRPSGQSILWVGLDFERKGGDILLGAFRIVRDRLPDAKLVLVGAKSPTPQPGVQQLGVVRDREKLGELYREASVFCLPARHEPYGLVVQEAMAYALPCVVSATGALPTIVDDGVCGRVSPLTEHDLASALIDLLSDPSRAEEMGRAGRLKVEHQLTWDAVAGRIIDGIQQRKVAAS